MQASMFECRDVLKIIFSSFYSPLSTNKVHGEMNRNYPVCLPACQFVQIRVRATTVLLFGMCVLSLGCFTMRQFVTYMHDLYTLLLLTSRFLTNCIVIKMFFSYLFLFIFCLFDRLRRSRISLPKHLYVFKDKYFNQLNNTCLKLLLHCKYVANKSSSR